MTVHAPHLSVLLAPHRTFVRSPRSWPRIAVIAATALVMVVGAAGGGIASERASAAGAETPAGSVSIYGYTSSTQTDTVPQGATSVLFIAEGGSGGAGKGAERGGHPGFGAIVTGWAPVTPGSTIIVDVGGAGGSEAANSGGFGGYTGGNGGTSTYWGASSAGGGGGGATVLAVGGTTLATAGAGGGGGGGTEVDGINPAGDGGNAGAVAQNGQTVNTVKGGVVGASPTGNGLPGQDRNKSDRSLPGGGGGAGVQGGGGGDAGGADANYISGGGGAAGTSAVDPSASIPAITTATETGDGQVVLVWNPVLTPIPGGTLTVANNQVQDFTAVFGSADQTVVLALDGSQLSLVSTGPQDQINGNSITFVGYGQRLLAVSVPGIPGSPTGYVNITVPLPETAPVPSAPDHTAPVQNAPDDTSSPYAVASPPSSASGRLADSGLNGTSAALAGYISLAALIVGAAFIARSHRALQDRRGR